MRILVTGADGFVGSQLVPYLKTQIPNAQIVGVGGPESTSGLDVRDRKAVNHIVGQNSPDFIVHLAALSAVSSSIQSPTAAFDINLGGTLNIIEAIQLKAPHSTLIFASSSEIYGRTFLKGEPLDEDALLAPANPYAVAKAAADLAVQEAANRSLRAVILRLFNHTGPRQTAAFVLPSFAKQIAHIEANMCSPLIKTGNLHAKRDFLDVKDVLDAYLLAIKYADELEQCEIFNIASGEARSINELLEYLLSLTKHNVMVQPDPSRYRPVDIEIAAGNSKRAFDKLRWHPKRRIEDTLQALLQYERRKASS